MREKEIAFASWQQLLVNSLASFTLLQGKTAFGLRSSMRMRECRAGLRCAVLPRAEMQERSQAMAMSHFISVIDWRRKLVRTAAFSLVLCSPLGAAAQSKVVQIEEHWELAVGEPDTQRSAPQATMVMSPGGDLEGQYFLFTINHFSVPSYEPGGMQVQLWNGEDAVDSHSSPTGALHHTGETIEWVQRLKVDDGVLSFEVVDGNSESWGYFGNDGSLAFSTPTTLESLNNFRPAISIGESQVGYAGNRVQRLLLKKLTWTTDDGESHELHAPIDIDADLDP